jgi:hypothetical protein
MIQFVHDTRFELVDFLRKLLMAGAPMLCPPHSHGECFI